MLVRAKPRYPLIFFALRLGYDTTLYPRFLVAYLLSPPISVLMRFLSLYPLFRRIFVRLPLDSML
jgi:hypothetical protein